MERKFLKAFLGGVKQGPKAVIKSILNNCDEFREEVPIDDDVSLLVMKVT